MESLDLSFVSLFLIVSAAFFTAILHGATGMAGGVVLAAVLSHSLGVKLAIPVTSVALILSHGSRIFLHFKALNWQTIGIVLVFSSPSILGTSDLIDFAFGGVFASSKQGICESGLVILTQ